MKINKASKTVSVVIGLGVFLTKALVAQEITVDSSKILATVNFENQKPIIPNAFTPNSDGLNDVFEVTIEGEDRFFEIYIFDRRGDLVFQSNSTHFEWNGTSHGQDAPAGTYVYLMKGKYELKGILTLLR